MKIIIIIMKRLLHSHLKAVSSIHVYVLPLTKACKILPTKLTTTSTISSSLQIHSLHNHHEEKKPVACEKLQPSVVWVGGHVTNCFYFILFIPYQQPTKTQLLARVKGSIYV